MDEWQKKAYWKGNYSKKRTQWFAVECLCPKRLIASMNINQCLGQRPDTICMKTVYMLTRSLAESLCNKIWILEFDGEGYLQRSKSTQEMIAHTAVGRRNTSVWPSLLNESCIILQDIWIIPDWVLMQCVETQKKQMSPTEEVKKPKKWIIILRYFRFDRAWLFFLLLW